MSALSGIYILDSAWKLDSCTESIIIDAYWMEWYYNRIYAIFWTWKFKITWTLVAGGGASVIYADTICDLSFSGELGDYGEYSYYQMRY